MIKNALTKPERWIIIGIPVLFIIGGILHFAYAVLWENPIVALFAPVNESIWEHAKMVVWPVILWWVLYACFRGKKHDIDQKKWYSGALAALPASLVVMPMFYYFYTGAFGVEKLWVDILILLVSILLGQMLGLHVYRHGKGISVKVVIILFILIVLLFMVFTFFPPHIPLFLDGVSGAYGIIL